ncbi:hypothetical protein [Streptomyces sp. NPDC102476]|uniref:hypothetical protein n=1 Tax=Streptomyces sp. NPDC102476 TaxID=3366181 RepID=UPI0037F4E5C7
MTRDQALTEARNAADKARRSAEYVDNVNAGGDSMGKVPRIAAAGELWASTARAYAALAAALPETTKEA